MSSEAVKTSLDYRHLKPEFIMSTEACDRIMFELDHIIGAISDQLNQAKTNVVMEGVYSDPDWYRAAQRALKGAKTVRAAVQNRRGQLSRANKESRQKDLERAFMDAAMKILPIEYVRQIWDRVYVDNPELTGRKP